MSHAEPLRRNVSKIRVSPPAMYPPTVASMVSSVGFVADVLSVSNMYGAASIQTMGVIASMSCMSPAIHGLAKSTMFVLSPLYALSGPLVGTSHAINIVLWNVITMLAVAALQGMIVLFFKLLSGGPFEEIASTLWCPNVAIVVATVLLQSSTSFALVAVRSPGDTAMWIVYITLLTMIAVTVVLIAGSVCAMRQVKGRHKDWDIPTDHKCLAFVLYRGVWISTGAGTHVDASTRRFGAMYANFIPTHKKFYPWLMGSIVAISILSVFPKGYIWCKMQLVLTIVVLLALAFFYIWFQPNRSRAISVCKGLTALVQCVLPFITLWSLTTATVMKASEAAILSQYTMLILEDLCMIYCDIWEYRKLEFLQRSNNSQDMDVDDLAIPREGSKIIT